MKRQSRMASWVKLGLSLVALAALQGCATGAQSDDITEPDAGLGVQATGVEVTPREVADEALVEDVDDGLTEDVDEGEPLEGELPGVPIIEYFNGVTISVSPKIRETKIHTIRLGCEPPPQPW